MSFEEEEREKLKEEQRKMEKMGINNNPDQYYDMKTLSHGN